jgi:NADPH:quinone reductase-like Zn-dependent oxidoreductase
MPAAAIDHFGGPEVLTAHVLPVPKIDATEVLIALDTAGVGPWDADIRAGWYPGRKPRFPLVLGTDGAGVVAEVGSRVRRLKVGDKVYAYSWANPKGGFYAEYVAVASEKVAHIPARLDLEHAGAIATTGLTALQGIDDALAMKRRETIIIHGASGGVGTVAIQFAKLRVARVLATASGIDGLELVRDMGADLAVDARHEDVAEAARRFAPDGLDAILALAGGDELERALETLRPGGRLAYPNGIEPEPKKRRGMKFNPMTGLPASANSRDSMSLSTPPSSKSRSRKHFRWSRPPRRTSDWRKGMCSEKSCCESASRDCATPRQKHFAFSTFCNSSIPGRCRAIHLAGRSGKNIKN